MCKEMSIGESTPSTIRWYTLNEAAQILRVAPRTLRLHACQRRFHPKAARKIGTHWRIRREAVMGPNDHRALLLVKAAATLYSGETIEAPRPLKSALRRLRIRSRRLSRKIKAAIHISY